MSTIFGELGLSDSDRVFNATQGQRVIYDAIASYVNRVNAEANAAYGVFVAETTTNHQERYRLPGGGYMQEINADQKPDAVKSYGTWDVAYPLRNYADAVSGSRVSRAYMTVAELENQTLGIVARSVNTMRRELLRALMYKEDETFVDPLWGSLTVKGLGTGSTDGVLYPPVLGSVTEAVRQRYNGSNYLSSAISDTNNPYATIASALIADFGQQQGNSNIAVFINTAQKAKTIALTDFDPLNDRFIVPGANINQLSNLPVNLPGTIIGRTDGCWVVEWPFMPSGYMLGVHLDSPAPLKKRIDPADTGLGDGLQLVTEDEEYPFLASYWHNRFGYGVGNRLNGYAMYLIDSTTYTSPTIS
jgi:hypothetical protein